MRLLTTTTERPGTDKSAKRPAAISWRGALLQAIRVGCRSNARRIAHEATREHEIGAPCKSLERETGIEPASPAWKAGALPLSYSRERSLALHAQIGLGGTILPRSGKQFRVHVFFVGARGNRHHWRCLDDRRECVDRPNRSNRSDSVRTAPMSSVASSTNCRNRSRFLRSLASIRSSTVFAHVYR